MKPEPYIWAVKQLEPKLKKQSLHMQHYGKGLKAIIHQIQKDGINLIFFYIHLS